MLFSERDIASLRLLCWCQYVCVEDLRKWLTETELNNPLFMGLIRQHTKSGALVLTNRDRTFLQTILNGAVPDLRAFLFAGERYGDVLSELENSEGDTDAKLITYGAAYRCLQLPVHLLSYDDTGAVQLQIMSVPDYRRKLTRAALKTQYQAPPDPAWDAFFQGLPFFMTANMDLRRLDAAVEKARQEGHPQIAIAALEGQAEAVLFSRYRDTGKARVFILTGEAVSEMTGRPPVPYTPPTGWSSATTTICSASAPPAVESPGASSS